MNKEIKDRLDKLENELKESKNEIHSLKSSVSLTIERGIGKLLSRFTKKQLILGSVIALFSISIIGIAGTVTKTYTFSSGDTISASEFNTNFDTLYTLVNGNLDDNNISSISASKITDTVSIVDGSATGYMKIGNMLMVWGSVTLPEDNSEFSATFPLTFLSAPIVTIAHGCTGTCSAKGNFYSVSTTKVTFKAYTADVVNYIAIGKWQ